MTITAKDLGLLPARLSLGATMLHHGVPKLGSEGPATHGPFLEQLGFRPGTTWTRLLGIAEVAAGAGMILGFATRLAALAVIGTQAVAVAKVHGPKGFSNLEGGWEFNALLMATALGVAFAGPGSLSVHALLERRLAGPPARWLGAGRWLGGAERWLLPRKRRAGLEAARLFR